MLVAAWMMIAAQAGMPPPQAPGPSPLGVSDDIRAPLDRPSRGAPGPRMLNLNEVFNDDNYPFFAKARGDVGRVRFMVQLDDRGVPTACEILEPAEADTLNEPTCDLIMEQGRFEPARDGRGKPIASTYTRRVAWLLMDPPPTPFRDSHQRVVLTFDGAGTAACRIEASADLKYDPRTCAMLVEMPMVRGMAAARAAVLRAQMARYATVSEMSAFTGPDALPRAQQVGMRKGEDLNDRTIARLTIDPAGQVSDCAIVEQGTVVSFGDENSTAAALTCERMAEVACEPSSTGGERTVMQVSAAYFRERD